MKQEPGPEKNNLSKMVFREAFDQYGDKLKVDLDSSSESVESVVDLEQAQVEPAEINEDEEEAFIKEQRSAFCRSKNNSAGSSDFESSGKSVSRRAQDGLLTGRMSPPKETSPRDKQSL